jgi:hypothetical protein
MEWFSKNEVTEHKTCVLIFTTSFVWNISHSKKNSARYKLTYIYTYSTRPCQILIKLEFSRQIFEKYQISWKSVQWEPICFMRTDGRTDKTKVIVRLQTLTATTVTPTRLNINVTCTVHNVKSGFNWCESENTRNIEEIRTILIS